MNSLRLVGKGTWANWKGAFLARHDNERLAAFELSNKEGLYGALGQVFPGKLIAGLPKDLLGEAAAFLTDGMDVTMELYEERPLSVQLPDQVEALIVEADAVVKGQTASSSYKPAVLENGVRVMVPPHIGAGTRIVVDVYEQAYVRRAD